MGTWAVLALLAVSILVAPVFRTRVSISVTVLAVGYAAFGVLGLIVFRRTNGKPVDQGPIAYYKSLSSFAVIGTFLGVALCLYLGAAAVRLASLARLGPPPPTERLQLNLGSSVLWLALIGVLVEVIGIGFPTLLNAPVYLAATGPDILLKAGGLTVPLGVLAASLVLFNKNHGFSAKFAAATIIVAAILVEIGKASRTFAVIPVLIFAGYWLVGRGRIRTVTLGAIVSGVLSLVLLSIPLTLRSRPEHGLVPGLHYLIADPTSFFTGPSNPFSNALLGAPLTLYVGRTNLPSLDTHALLVSLNPAPSTFTDWSAVSRTLRLNSTEPFSALGELLNHGWLALILYSIVLGALLELLTATAKRTPGKTATALEAAIIATTGLILVRSTQYNLRTETRLIYYLTASVVVVSVAVRVFASRSSEDNNTSRSVVAAKARLGPVR